MREFTSTEAQVDPISLFVVAAVVTLGLALVGCEGGPKTKPDEVVGAVRIEGGAGQVQVTPVAFVPESPPAAPVLIERLLYGREYLDRFEELFRRKRPFAGLHHVDEHTHGVGLGTAVLGVKSQ